jgi:hypothetical protein
LQFFPAACQDTGKTVTIPKQRSFHDKAALGTADAPSSGNRQGTPDAETMKPENFGCVYIEPCAVTIVIPQPMLADLPAVWLLFAASAAKAFSKGRCAKFERNQSGILTKRHLNNER